MDIKTIRKTLQYVIDEVLPDTEHNITSLDVSQVKNDDGFELHLSLILKTEKESKVGFGRIK